MRRSSSFWLALCALALALVSWGGECQDSRGPAGFSRILTVTPADPDPAAAITIEGRSTNFAFGTTSCQGELFLIAGTMVPNPLTETSPGVLHYENGTTSVEKADDELIVTIDAPLANGRYTAVWISGINGSVLSRLPTTQSIIVSDCGPRVYNKAPIDSLGGASESDKTLVRLDSAAVGVSYDEAIPLSGGVEPFTFEQVTSIAYFGAPSPTLTFDPATRRVTGTPIAEEGGRVYVLRLRITDSCSTGTRSSFLEYEIPVQTLPFCLFPITVTGLSADAGTVGEPFESQLEFTGGLAPIQTLLNGGSAALPPGLHLANVGGLITGTPTTAGTYTFDVALTDNCDPSNHTIAPVTITIVEPGACLPVGMEPFTGGTVNRGADYFASIFPTGGVPPYEVTVTDLGALPPGVFFETSVDMFQGAPTDNGTFNVPIRIVDSCPDGAQTFEQTLTIVVAEASCPAFAISSGAAPAGLVGVPYSFAVTTSGGEGTPTILLMGPGGVPPPGLSFSAGQISGTPTTAGEYIVNITAYDHCSPPQIIQGQSITIVINAS